MHRLHHPHPNRLSNGRIMQGWIGGARADAQSSPAADEDLVLARVGVVDIGCEGCEAGLGHEAQPGCALEQAGDVGINRVSQGPSRTASISLRMWSASSA
jgi:hypothetical protein